MAHVYDRTSRFVFSLLMRILRRQEDAEEVLVEVYTQAWRSAASFDPRRGSGEAWLSTIARSRAIDRLRSRKARPDLHHANVTAVEPFDETRHGRQHEPLSADHARFQAAAMLMALAPDERRLVELAYYDGYTHRELADRLGLPLGTVKTRIRHSLLKMRRAVGGEMRTSTHSLHP